MQTSYQLAKVDRYLFLLTLGGGMTKRQLELKVFTIFVGESPDFLDGELFCLEQPADDPPDIMCQSLSGRRIAFELKEWLNEEQMAEAQRREGVEQTILAAVAPLPPNEMQNIAHLWLFPRMRVRQTDHESFRTELLQLVEEIEGRWPNERDWHGPQGARIRDFDPYPTLRKYLHEIKFFPMEFRRGWQGSTHWVRFPNRASHYTERTMLDPLLETLETALTRYRRARPANVEEFNLMLHYSQAFEFNAPVETQEFGFEQAMECAREFINDDPGGFDRIVLVKAIEPYSVYTLH
jgi:hypothetical protein